MPVESPTFAPTQIVSSPEGSVTFTPLPEFGHISGTDINADIEYAVTPERHLPLAYIPPSNDRWKVIGDNLKLVKTAFHESQHAIVGEKSLIEIQLWPEGHSLARTYFTHIDAPTAAASGLGTPWSPPEGTAGDEFQVVNVFGESWGSSVKQAASAFNGIPEEVQTYVAEMMAYLHIKYQIPISRSLFQQLYQRAEVEYALGADGINLDDLWAQIQDNDKDDSPILNIKEKGSQLPDSYIRDTLINTDGDRIIETIINGKVMTEKTKTVCGLCGEENGVHAQNCERAKDSSMIFGEPTITNGGNVEVFVRSPDRQEILI